MNKISCKRIVWVTDIHLNFLRKESKLTYFKQIKAKNPHFVLITGDISESRTLIPDLKLMYSVIKKPMYFVLGNHDYYEGSIEQTALDVKSAFSHDQERGIYHLPTNQLLIDSTAVIGVDNWYDTKSGIPGYVTLSDFMYITEYREAKSLQKQIIKQANKANKHLKQQLTEITANKDINRVIIALHVPPFVELSTYGGKRSDDYFLPYFSSKSTGEVILSFAKKHKKIKFEVYCGHTHSAVDYTKLDNLKCYCGASEYYSPLINGIIEV